MAILCDRHDIDLYYYEGYEHHVADHVARNGELQFILLRETESVTLEGVMHFGSSPQRA